MEPYATAKLVKQLKKGDEDAYEDLIRRYTQILYKTAACYLSDTEDIADAVQETMITVWQKIDTLKEERYFSSWVIRILINICKNILKRRKMQREQELTPDLPDAEDRYAGVEWIQIIRGFSDEEKELFLMYYLVGYRIKEISAILNMTESAIRSKLYRIRKKLKGEYL